MWTAASLIAAIAQQGLIAADILDSRLMLDDASIAGALLIAAGLYQLTPLKQRCLDRCRSPLAFLMIGWRPGLAGAVPLGLGHGLYCLGCCWMLMALLFVGGVMNLLWIALLALFVLLEKVVPRGELFARLSAILLAGAGLLVILAGQSGLAS